MALSGPDYFFDRDHETERFDDAEAIRLIAAGIAVPCDQVAYETAVNPPAPEIRTAKPEPFGGKGDHDGNGKVGGARKPAGKRGR